MTDRRQTDDTLCQRHDREYGRPKTITPPWRMLITYHFNSYTDTNPNPNT